MDQDLVEKERLLETETAECANEVSHDEVSSLEPDWEWCSTQNTSEQWVWAVHEGYHMCGCGVCAELAAVCALLGKGIHAVFGQRGRLRSDESLNEKHARVSLVYMLDGPCALLATFYVVQLCRAASGGDGESLWPAVFGLGICGGIICGNGLLLHAMSTRNQTGVRVCMVAFINFVLALLLLLVLGIVYSENWTSNRFTTYVFRFLTVLGLAADLSQLTQSWNEPLYNNGEHKQGSWQACLLVVVMVLVGSAVWVAIFAVAAGSEDGWHALWSVLG